MFRFERQLRRGEALEGQNSLRATLAGLHPYRAVQPDRLAVEHGVLDYVRRERAVLGGTAEARREGHLLAEGHARRLRQSREERRVEEPGRDSADTDAQLGQVAGDG